MKEDSQEVIQRENFSLTPEQALKLLEIMIYSLNNKHAIKPTNIVYQQICSNLYYTVNEIGRNHLKADDKIIFNHHVGKIESRQEYIPSIDINSLIPPVRYFIEKLI